MFARFDATDGVDAVMSCSRPGNVPNPQCSVHFRTNRLAIDVSLIRRDELDHLDEILTTVRAFVRCLVQ